jgi:hypothetical protein
MWENHIKGDDPTKPVTPQTIAEQAVRDAEWGRSPHPLDGAGTVDRNIYNNAYNDAKK